MSDKTLNDYSMFESLKHTTKNSHVYWEARELQKALGYDDWRNFDSVIYKAIQECRNQNKKVRNHFIRCKRYVGTPIGYHQRVVDFKLSKYACYLVAKNGYSKKEKVLLGREYFYNEIKNGS